MPRDWYFSGLVDAFRFQLAEIRRLKLRLAEDKA